MKSILKVSFLVIAALSVLYVEARWPGFQKNLSLEEDQDHGEISHSEQTAFSLGSLFNFVSPGPKYMVTGNTTQFVVLSFDGSKSVDMLNETLDFQSKMMKEGKKLNFTYFINAVYLLTKENARLYVPPEGEPGTSRIGFSESVGDIQKRIAAFNRALRAGNEIGSHAVGHFDGSQWTHNQWKQEFASFDTLLTNVRQNNTAAVIDAPLFSPQSIKGFRAPQLGVDDDMYRVLSEEKFLYDTSGIGKPQQWPVKDTYGTWRIPLGIIYLGQAHTPVVAMDYSIWAHQSGAIEVAKKGTPLWQSLYDEVEVAYKEYFNTNYNGGRAPVIIGHHFSKWNDGVYWEVMKSFAESVCGKPDVQCVTFSTLVEYLNTHGAPKIDTTP